MELISVREDPITPRSPVDVAASPPPQLSSHDQASSSTSAPSPPPASSPETSSNSSPRSPTQLDRRSKAQILKSLKESIPHAMALKELEGDHEFLRKKASSHRKDVRRLSKDLYQVVSIYALLQGVLFAAVAQTSVFTCEEWWGPVLIAVAVSAGTLCAVLDKLWNVNKKKEKVEQFTQRQRDVSDRIDKLRCEGSNVDLGDMDTPPAQAQQHTFLQEPGTPAASGYEHCFFSVHAVLVLVFLLGFSVLIILSCIQMICSGCRCHAGS